MTKRLLDLVRARYPDLDPVRTGHELVRRQITIMVEDVIEEAQRRLAVAKPQSVEDVHGQSHALVAFSDTMRTDEKVLKR
ncbi:deoxyguanosinetriphosphate triphosphohydrolase, partial [Guyparkeria sp. 1SP6A2]|nr:deoxyguanosinetriphosphate triphosphohydrolase [Guyparkeria sp. 1SP6A2]